jgi:hypothetical protein
LSTGRSPGPGHDKAEGRRCGYPDHTDGGQQKSETAERFLDVVEGAAPLQRRDAPALRRHGEHAVRFPRHLDVVQGLVSLAASHLQIDRANRQRGAHGRRHEPAAGWCQALHDRRIRVTEVRLRAEQQADVDPPTYRPRAVLEVCVDAVEQCRPDDQPRGQRHHDDRGGDRRRDQRSEPPAQRHPSPPVGKHAHTGVSRST